MEYQNESPDAAQKAGTILSALPLQKSINEQSEQINKLRNLLEELSVRLSPVRAPSPKSDNTESPEARESHSLFTEQIVSQTIQVKSLQLTIHELLEELEV